MLKEVIPIYQVITAGDMSGAITSKITDILYKDTVVYQAVWTGTPTGTIQILGSASYNPGLPQSNGAPNAGIWEPLVFPVLAGLNPAGGASQASWKIDQCAFRWLKLVYTAVSGTGTLNVYVCGKSLG